MSEIEVLLGDITKLNVDAIVNPANRGALFGGGGVTGKITLCAGEDFINECKKLNGCNTGQSKITKGYNLSAKYVIHTVGPIWRGGNNDEIEQLVSCYKTSLNLAKENNIKTIAFPSISCGAFNFPIEQAVKIAVSTIKEYIKEYNGFEKIIFIDIRQEIIDEYKKVLSV